ncbi:peptidylprolyl isomerase [Zobellella denitrificans]|jgi:peptidyl-prolyl cis-trans isomerase D|uniref:Periplasmic chaperone PpiD n=1 Tax=Zobellella denitrificans TaxID=347534 RepID=A0A291HMN0_9GAMM|nr:SurA N-terminal domain-containing protein [Zobellella denitrificans]ATG73369.1 peptidylprolyl isomerase [Zobellella denitrificans]
MFFEKLRAGAQGTTSKIVLGLIILSFALAGVGSYVTRPVVEVAAVVNGDEISAQALENAYRNERARLESQLGPQFNQLLGDPAYVEQIRRSVLEQMVEQRLIDQKVAELKLRASDEQVRNAIRNLPEFQQDGRFNNERYQQLLARSGISPEQLRDSVRQDLSRQMLLSALVGSSFTLEAEAGRLDRLSRQQRDAQYVRLPLSDFSERAEPSDEEVEAYYRQQPQQFQRPEQVRINYLLLDAGAVSSADIDEQAIADYYQANLATYSRPEQRKVAHIMVNKGRDAEQKIQAIAERLAAGEAFAELARTESDDSFSGARGGELEWMEAGTMDPAFDQAAFALAQVGDVSGVVESEFGLHLITLLEVQPAQTRPLAEVRDSIAERLARDEAANAFYAREQRLAELAFEFPDSLDMAAQELGLEVKSTDYFSTQDAPAEINDPRVLTQAFSERLRQQGVNSDLIELGSNRAIVIHVTEYRPAAVRDFAEVREQARELALAAKARELAAEAADALLAAWRDGEEQAWLEQHGLAVTELSGLTRESEEDPALLDALFAMPAPTEQPSLRTLALAGGDQLVLRLNGVTTPEDSSELLAQIREGQSSLLGQREYQSLLAALKAAGKIEYRRLSSQTDNF